MPASRKLVVCLGPMRSGKTTIAKELAEQQKLLHMDFDGYWWVRTPGGDSKSRLKKCKRIRMAIERDSVLDGWDLWDPNPMPHEMWPDLDVSYVVCLEEQSVIDSRMQDEHPRSKQDAAHLILQKIFSDFPNPVAYHQGQMMAWVDASEMLRLSPKRMAQILHEKISGMKYEGFGGDWRYSDIDLGVMNFPGYERSRGTLDRISSALSGQLSGRRVVEVGPNTGLVSIALAQQAASVIALEKNQLAVNIMREVVAFRGDWNVDVRLWDMDGGHVLPPADVMICANTLHHTKDPKQSLSRLLLAEWKDLLLEMGESLMPVLDKSNVVSLLPARTYSKQENRVFVHVRRE